MGPRGGPALGAIEQYGGPNRRSRTCGLGGTDSVGLKEMPRATTLSVRTGFGYACRRPKTVFHRKYPLNNDLLLYFAYTIKMHARDVLHNSTHSWVIDVTWSPFNKRPTRVVAKLNMQLWVRIPILTSIWTNLSGGPRTRCRCWSSSSSSASCWPRAGSNQAQPSCFWKKSFKRRHEKCPNFILQQFQVK